MATQTPNYNLIKPDYTDPVDVKDLNDNSDIIDSALAAKANLVGGKVPASELPSYVDDVVEGYYYNGAFYSDSGHTTPITGETGKIYIDLDTESCYRWTGSIYVKISSASDALYVEFTESSGVFSCDTGLADMYDALDEGREVIGVYDNNGVQELYFVGNYSETGDYATFYSYNSTGKIAELFGTGSGSETWSYDEFSLTGGGGGQLPTATNLGDVPSWNPGTQLWEITHKGTITSGSTGYATGGDVYTAIGNIPQIPVGTNTGDILVWNGSAWVSQQLSGRCPIGYQEVEFIRSDGTGQYIDLGDLPTQNTRVTLKIQNAFGTAGTQNCWIGLVANDENNAFVVQKHSTDYFQICYGTDQNWVKSNIIVDSNEHTLYIERGLQKVDNNTIATKSSFTATTSTGCIFPLFARQYYGTFNYGALDVIEYFRYEEQVLVNHLIPCYRKSDNEIGMYDLVTDTFFTNAGTGTFLKGADV